MVTATFRRESTLSTLKVHHETVQVETQAPLEFIDITDSVLWLVERSGVRDGIVNVQTRHTTTAIIVNENEPLLLEDMRRTLERLAPQEASYQHNDFTIRTVNMGPDETPNGHSHCKAMFLKTSETLNIVDGVIQLGRWQRIFLVELDGTRKRTVSVMVFGSE